MDPSLYKKGPLIFLFLPVPFLFYWFTCLPGIGLGDSVLFIHAIRHLTVSTWINNHNLTALWGWLFQFLPFGDIAYRGNLSCAFSSSIAVCIFYLSVYSVHRSWITALVSALFLMISQSMWWHATDLADYSMVSVFVAGALYLYVRLFSTGQAKYLYALFFLAGLALFQHYLLGSLLVGAAAALLCRILKHRQGAWPLLWKSAAFFLLGLVPWLLTFIHDVSVNHSITQTLSGCMGGPFKGLYFKQSLWNGLTQYFFLLFIQFPSLYLVPVAAGLFFFLRAWRLSEGSIGLVFTFLPVFYFELGTNSWAVFAQLLPTFVISAFWASFAVHWALNHPLVKKSQVWRGVLAAAAVLSFGWTVYFYAHLSQWGENPNSIWYPSYNNSYTYNCYRLNEFLANPDKRNYRDIEDFCHLLLKKLPPDSEYWDSDSRLFYQVKEYYQQYYHQRPDLDIQLINSFGFANWGADADTFARRLKSAYLTGKDLFLCSLGHPFASPLQKLPYRFEKYPLDGKRWVYRLITVKDINPSEHSLWGRWDYLPTDKPTLMALTMDNVLDFQQGFVLYQQDMSTFGPFWKNGAQIFFRPARVGAQIGFLLRFRKTFKGDLTLNMTTAFDAGMVDVLLNDVRLNQQPVDLYTVGINNKNFTFKGVSFEAGNNILSIRVVGKDDKTKDMNLGIDTVKITPHLP